MTSFFYWRNLLEENMKNHEPNQTTIKAIEEAEQMINDPNTPSYSTIDELIDHRRINCCIR